MKAAIAALLVIAVIIAAVAWNAHLTHSFLTDFNTADSITDRRALWEKESFRLQLTINRRFLHNIESALDQLEAYADEPDSPECIAAKSALDLALENIKTLESFSGAP